MQTPTMSPHLLWIVALVLSPLHGAESLPEDLLRQGLFEEEANQNLDKAAEHYRAVIAAHDRQRALAASATFRLGEIARKKNDKEGAAAAFRMVAERFPEQAELARLSRENLTALGVAPSAPAITTEEEIQPGPFDPEFAEFAEINRLKELARNSPDLIDGPNEEGWRPMHLAAKNGWTKVAAYLLANKADPDSRTTLEQFAPLHLAAIYGHLGITRPLVTTKADLNVTLEIDIGHIKSMPVREEAAVEVEGKLSALDLALIYDRKEIVRTLIAAGADLQRRGPIADSKVAIGVAESLFRARGNFDENITLTSLHLAILLKRNESAKDLLKAGGLPKTSDADTIPTPLHLAVLHNPDMVAPLLQAKADPKLGMSGLQLTPLHEAANQGNTEIAKLLIDAGADIKASDLAGRTPLHYAASAEMVERLVSLGADPNAKDTSGLTPLDALARSNSKVMEALMQHGATIDDPKALLERTDRSTLAFVRERIAYPRLHSPDSILLSYDWLTGFGGLNSIVTLETRPAPGSPPPPLAEALLSNFDFHRGSTKYLSQLRILRRMENGNFKAVLDWDRRVQQKAPTPWPTLEWGDIVEWNRADGENSFQIPNDLFKKTTPRTVRIQIESDVKTISFPEDSDAIWLKDSFKLLDQWEANLVDRQHISIVRIGVEKPIEINLSEQDSRGFRLIDGDVIHLKLSDAFWETVSKDSITLIKPSSETTRSNPSSLASILSLHSNRSRVDWRNIRVLSREGETRSKNIDMVEWVRSLPPRDKWNKQEITAKDLMVEGGQVLMIPSLEKADEAAKKVESEISAQIEELGKFLRSSAK
jgi:ankyrin repeat protein